MGARDPARARAPRAARRGPDETAACARVSSGSRPGRRTGPADDERPGRNGRSSARLVRLARRECRRPRRSRHPRRPGPDADAPTRAGVSTHAGHTGTKRHTRLGPGRVCRRIPVMPERSDTPASGPAGCVDASRSCRDESTHPPRSGLRVAGRGRPAGPWRDPADPRARVRARTRTKASARRAALSPPDQRPFRPPRSPPPPKTARSEPPRPNRPGPGPPAAGHRPRPPPARTTRRRPPPTPADGPDQPRARPRAAPTRSSPAPAPRDPAQRRLHDARGTGRAVPPEAAVGADGERAAPGRSARYARGGDARLPAPERRRRRCRQAGGGAESCDHMGILARPRRPPRADRPIHFDADSNGLASQRPMPGAFRAPREPACAGALVPRSACRDRRGARNARTKSTMQTATTMAMVMRAALPAPAAA